MQRLIVRPIGCSKCLYRYWMTDVCASLYLYWRTPVSPLPGCVDDARSVECLVDLLVAVVAEVGVIGSPVYITSIKQPFNRIDRRTVHDNIGAVALDYGSCIRIKVRQESLANTKVSARHRWSSGAAWWIVIQYPAPYMSKNPWKFERIAVQGHPRSMILIPIERAYTSSY